MPLRAPLAKYIASQNYIFKRKTGSETQEIWRLKTGTDLIYLPIEGEINREFVAALFFTKKWPMDEFNAFMAGCEKPVIDAAAPLPQTPPAA